MHVSAVRVSLLVTGLLVCGLSIFVFAVFLEWGTSTAALLGPPVSVLSCLPHSSSELSSMHVVPLLHRSSAWTPECAATSA